MTTDLRTMSDAELLRVRAALKAANGRSASKEALDELRAALESHPGAWKIAGDMARIARDEMLKSLAGTPTVCESLKHGLRRLGDELRQPGDGAAEALLIDQVVTCWLDEQFTRTAYAQRLSEGLSRETADMWQRKLTLTQARYLRAIETLARVRRLIRATVQINIAQPGAQQVNVAGDVVTAGLGRGPC